MGCMSGCPVLASLGTLVCNIAVNIPLAFAAVEELEMNSLSIRRKQPYAEGATPGTSEAQPAARSLLALAVSCKLHEGDMGRGVLIPSDIRSVLSCLALSCLVLSCLVLSCRQVGSVLSQACCRNVCCWAGMVVEFTSCTSCRPSRRPPKTGATVLAYDSQLLDSLVVV